MSRNKISIIAGPCSIESESQLESIASIISELGLSWIRGGAFKPRSNIHSFQGLGVDGLKIIRKVATKYDLRAISEATSSANLDDVLNYCDGIQIGARNMTNYQLLTDVGLSTKEERTPVLFKRGMASTINEWLCACEYISQYNDNIMLCERGLRSFNDATRFTLDISAVPVVHRQSNFPICVDVSHAAGNADYVPALARAAVAAGADAVMVEVHPEPKKALSDGPQQLNIDQFVDLVEELDSIADTLGKELV